MSRAASKPLKWHGGKHYLVPWIRQFEPMHTHYVEPFFGGGAYLFAKPMGASEVVNDISRELTNFWKCLADEAHFSMLRRRVEATPFSAEAWADAEQELSGATEKESVVEAAFAFFVKFRQSRQGLGKEFATLSRTRTRRGMNEQASSWLSAIEGLPEAHARLKGVVVLCGSAIDVIRQQDDYETFFYLDPPYHPDSRSVPDAYEHEMSDADHRALLETLSTLSGKFILSGYRVPLYDEAAKANGWRREDRKIANHSSSAATKQIKTESLWMNFDCPPTPSTVPHE